MKTIPIRNIKIHVVTWTLFIAYEIVASSRWSGGNKLANFWDDAANYTLFIGLFYFNAHIALPTTLGGQNKYYSGYLLFLIAQLATYLGFEYAILFLCRHFEIELTPAFKGDKDYVIRVISRGIYFLGFSVAYWFALSSIRNQQRVNELETLELKASLEHGRLQTEVLSTENAYLKSQINPHFLFNTLSFLYNAISKYNNEIAESVITLSDVMRYSLADTGEDGKVPLALELDHIENLISLNQARFNHRLCIKFEIRGETAEYRIIPLALITLVENIFKYGNLNDPENPASILAEVTPKQLSFSTYNLIKRQTGTTSHGIGLENLKNRLNNFHKYDLKTDSDNRFYSVRLILWSERPSTIFAT